MGMTVKKKLRLFVVILLSVLGIGVFLYGIGHLLVSIIDTSSKKAEVEYYNQILPQKEIELPYNIRDYDVVNKSGWYFDSLSVKVKENRKYEDFWVYQDNFDILFCSNSRLYVRKGLSLYTEVTADNVRSICFSDTEQKHTEALSFIPNFTPDEACQFAEVLLSDEFDSEKIEFTSVFSDADDVPIYWYSLLYLRDSESVCYDGIYVSHPKKYAIAESTSGDLYLRLPNGQYKALPQSISEKIQEAWLESA